MRSGVGCTAGLKMVVEFDAKKYVRAVLQIRVHENGAFPVSGNTDGI